jgi:hypothetical protein
VYKSCFPAEERKNPDSLLNRFCKSTDVIAAAEYLERSAAEGAADPAIPVMIDALMLPMSGWSFENATSYKLYLEAFKVQL